MNILFEEVTTANRDVAKAMGVAPGQESFIETVPACLAEADETPLWNPILIKVAENYVGFAMYGLWKAEGTSGRVWLDRFLIDRNFQGRGYSKAALPSLLERIKDQFGYSEIFLSVFDTNLVAIALYERFGFHFNGEVTSNGEKVMVVKLDGGQLD